MNTRNKLINSKQVNTRLPIHMVQQLKYVSKERGVTEGSIVEAAVRNYLGKTENEDVVLKKIDRMSRQIDKLRKENKAMLEVVSSFVRVYLTHTQEIPEHQKREAENKGSRKFARFMELVAKNLESSKPFFEELELKQFTKEDFAQ